MNYVEHLAKEPWVKLATGTELAKWGKEDEVAYNQASRQSQKLAFYINAFDFIQSLEIKGDYYEFGCHRARTFRMALTEARRHGLSTMKFCAFDSFEGLPKPQNETGITGYFQGALTTAESEFTRLIQEHGIYVENVSTIKGYYQSSLTPELQQKFAAKENKIAIVNVDCDLYESAIPVFNFIEPLIQEGTLIYIDDYFAGFKGSPATGPARAFHEFERKSRFKFAEHMTVGWWGRSYIAYLNK